MPNQQAVKSVRNRTPSLHEIGKLWAAVEASKRLSAPVKLIFKLTILAGQRRGEVAGARLSEVVGDVWTIAADVVKAGRIVTEGRMKNGTEQRVYLSSQAKQLFEEARKTTSLGDYFFPANTRLGETRLPHIHGDSITQAMARLCEATNLADLSIHDMRRGLGNFLKDAGYGKEVRDLMLSHKDQSVDGVHYSSSAKMEVTCREAWQKWADYLDGAMSQRPGNVVSAD